MTKTEYQIAQEKAQMVLDLIDSRQLSREKPIVNIADAFAGTIIAQLAEEDGDLDTQAIFDVITTHPQYTEVEKGAIELAMIQSERQTSISTDWGYFANMLDGFIALLDSLQTPATTA